MLKSIVTIAGILAVTFAASAGKAGAVRDFVGSYRLEQKIEGNCPAELVAEEEQFLNQASSPSLGIYCADINECTRVEQRAGGPVSVIDNIIGQFDSLNAGLVKRENVEPMFGKVVGYTIQLETLSGGQLKKDWKMVTLNGQIFVHETFSGVLKDGKFSYESAGVNYINNPDGDKFSNKCVYRKL